MARSSVSLLPTSESAGLPVEAVRAGGSSEVAVAAGSAGGWSEVAVAATAAASVVDAEGIVRGRVEVRLFADGDFCAVEWDEVNLNKSSRMFRDASQPVRSNKPTPTVCVIRILIVIPPTTPEFKRHPATRSQSSHYASGRSAIPRSINARPVQATNSHRGWLQSHEVNGAARPLSQAVHIPISFVRVAKGQY
jgi:hypothetical protein